MTTFTVILVSVKGNGSGHNPQKQSNPPLNTAHILKDKMLNLLRQLIEIELQEYYKHWEGYYDGTTTPISTRANRAYDRYARYSAILQSFGYFNLED